MNNETHSQTHLVQEKKYIYIYVYANCNLVDIECCYDVLRPILLRKISEFPSGTRTF